MIPNIRATAFLVRSLRQESRLFSHHLLRAGLAMTVFLLFLFGVLTYANRGGTGGSILWQVVSSCYWFVTLVGGMYFSTAIVEEKEEQTLPLLRMTGASAFSILIGKSIPRLASVVLLIIVTMPFVLLAITLGGVQLRGVLTAILGILCYALMLSQIGLLASVVSKDAQRAFFRTLLMWGVLEFLPLWTWLAAHGVAAWGKFSSASEAEAFLSAESVDQWRTWLAWAYVKLNWFSSQTQDFALQRNLSGYLTGFSFGGLWRPQMTAHLAVSAVAFLSSWSLFGTFTTQSVAGAKDDKQKSIRRSRPRPWRNALAWKSWRHQSGGMLWFLMRLFVLPASVMSLAFGAAMFSQQKTDPEAMALTLIVSGFVVAIAHLVIVFGRVFNSEIKDRTLSSLLLLPVSRHRIVCHSVFGLIPAMLSATSCLICGFAVMSYAVPSQNTMDSPLDKIWFYQLIALGFTAVLLGIRLSIRMTYGGMLLAVVACWIGGPICFSLLMELSRTFLPWKTVGFIGDNVIPVLLFFVEVPLCAILYFGIIRSLERAAEKA